MRVTMKMFYERFISSLNRNLGDALNAQEKLSSGKRVNRPSDDPVAASRILSYQKDISCVEEYERSIKTAKSYLTTIDSALTELSDIIARAREISMQGASESIDDEGRNILASEVEKLMDAAMEIANTKIGDRYVFSGFSSRTQPLDPSTGEVVTDAGVVRLRISERMEVELNVPASELFSIGRYLDSDPVEGVLPDYNWDNGGALPVADADPVSALYTKSSGFSSDTDVFTSSGGTLTVKSSPDDPNPAVVSIAPGATLADVRDALNATGKVRAHIVDFSDGGTPDLRIVISSVTVGNSVNIELGVTTSDAAGTGLNLLSRSAGGGGELVYSEKVKNYNYTVDPKSPSYYSFNNSALNEKSLLRALNFIKEALAAGDVERVRKGLDYLDGVQDRVFRIQAKVGASLSVVEKEEKVLESKGYDIRSFLSSDRDADIAQVVSELQQKQTALEGLRSVSARIFSLSLFDFLR